MKKLLLKSITLIALALVTMNCSEAAITVQGTVKDAINSQFIAGVAVREKGTTNQTQTDKSGAYSITVHSDKAVLQFTMNGYQTKELALKGRTTINVKLQAEVTVIDIEEDMEYEALDAVPYGKRPKMAKERMVAYDMSAVAPAPLFSPAVTYESGGAAHNTEGYATIHENGFRKVGLNPLSTFSIDVDAASYANMRRFINNGQKPPKDAVRIEEMINYFNYDYPQPDGEHPFSVNHELSVCPWNKDHLLLHIGIQGKEIPTKNLPASNLVFLLDVSGSMSSHNKLPLLKRAFKLLVNQLRPEDRVAIVVYAGASGVVLPSTPGNQKNTIMEALNRLQAGGSTAGASGLKLAYQVAEENFMEDGNNRIILATDGDFNVGISSNAEMERLIEKEREKGISISVLGFGIGNYKDDKMEIIADKGNGNYSYIDNIQEANKVLVNEFGGTLFTIAKDVKIQLEFNPAKVKEYRLIGYENRLLNEEDFKNDKVDAGELGSGHTVTALYEIVLKNSDDTNTELKYQNSSPNELAKNSNELLNLKLRYKQPDGYTSKLIETTVAKSPIALEKTSNNFQFSAAVAEFGMCLRESEHKGTATWNSALEMASKAKGTDTEGYRSELIQLIKRSSAL